MTLPHAFSAPDEDRTAEDIVTEHGDTVREYATQDRPLGALARATLAAAGEEVPDADE